MKKRLLICVLICAMALALMVPAMASSADTVAAPTYVSDSPGYEELAPNAVELTRIYWRTITGGQLQFRVWGITSGRWLTDWTNVV